MTQLVLHNEHRQTAVIPREELRTWSWHRMDEHHYGISILFKGGDEIDLGPYTFDEAEKVEAKLLELVEPSVKKSSHSDHLLDAISMASPALRKVGTGEVKTIDYEALQKAPWVYQYNEEPKKTNTPLMDVAKKMSGGELEDFLVKKATGQWDNLFDIFLEFTSKLRPLLKMHDANTNVEFSLPPKAFDLLMSQAEGRLQMREIPKQMVRGFKSITEINGFRVERR